MKKGRFTIHANGGGVFDVTCDIDLTEDGETVGLEFPQLSKPDDNIGPMAYVSMDGTDLKISLTDRDDVQLSFCWNEKSNRWIQNDPA